MSPNVNRSTCASTVWRTRSLMAGGTVAAAQHLHGGGRLLGGGRNEANAVLAAWQDFDDLVVALLPFSGISRRSILGKSVKTPDNLGGDRDRALPREDPVQRD